MSKQPPFCEAPAKNSKSVFAILFGKKCGAPAVYLTKLNRVVCKECGEEQQVAHLAGKTLLSIANPGTPYPLYPLHEQEP